LPDTSIKSANFLTPTLKIDWCRVPAGTFLMGSSDRDPDAYSDEKPQHRLYLPTFHIAKYPITNAQYATFIRATNHDPQPNYWQNNTFPRNQGNHPVRSVNCHEAIAFCEWAALVTRRPIRLPTEAEWEKAARGRDGRIYPWGNRWEPNRCNADSRYKSTTPVDQFPRGQSPYGVLDMIGNVWEWTSTAYADYPYDPHDGRENIQDTDKSHVRRGGAWWNSPRGARAASRGRYWDGNWPNLGFRVCVATPFS
jgi:formylglycine-generating enzyme required for sulfatase activity